MSASLPSTRTLGIRKIYGLLFPTVGLESLKKRNISCLCRRKPRFGLGASGFLRRDCWLLLNDVSGKPIRSICKGAQRVLEVVHNHYRTASCPIFKKSHLQCGENLKSHKLHFLSSCKEKSTSSITYS